jgi:hypothetical protein
MFMVKDVKGREKIRRAYQISNSKPKTVGTKSFSVVREETSEMSVEGGLGEKVWKGRNL